MKIEMNLAGLDGVLNLLQSLPAEVVSKNGGPVKSALRKAALVIQKQELINLEIVTSNQTKEGNESTGLLKKSVIVSRGKAPSGGNGERYIVRIKRRSYDRKSGKVVTTLKTAQILEYGSSKQPAEPWIRPAFNAKAQESINTATTELVKKLNNVVKKLAKGT